MKHTPNYRTLPTLAASLALLVLTSDALGDRFTSTAIPEPTANTTVHALNNKGKLVGESGGDPYL